MNTKQKFALIFWLLCVGLALGLYLKNPQMASAPNVIAFFDQFGTEMLVIYILVSFVRGFFFIPSTPLVIAGCFLFPDNLIMVLIISMLGVLSSATGLYFFANSLGLGSVLENKFPSKIKAWSKRLQSKKSFYFILGWSVFPFVPTDLICYVGGVVKTPFKYVVIGVLVGELILNTCYIYFFGSIAT